MVAASSSKKSKGGSSDSRTNVSYKNKRKFTPDGGGGGASSGSKPASSSGDVDKQEPSASNKKRALKHERQSHRRHSDAVVASKEIWNKLRLKTNTKEETSAMTDELMSLLTGKFAEVAMQHDASRVVQAAVQYGSAAQRLQIVKELSGGEHVMAELCKIQYAHFVVLKMIKYCARDDECVKIIVKSLKGHIPKLAVHAVGARVVELLFATFPPKSTSLLRLELYGPQFALFASGDLSSATSSSSNHPTLERILEEQPPEKRAAALEHVLNLLNKGIEKSLFGFAYYQQLFCEYVTVASPNDVRAVAPSVVDHSIHLLSTRQGSRIVAECATYGTPKDRKRIMKSLKGYTRSSLLHRDAYVALLRLVDVTDDTVAVNKSVLAELQVDPDNGKAEGIGKKKVSPILDIALSDTGSKLFLLLLSTDDDVRRRYFDPAELEVLRSGATVKEGGEDVPTSKKNPDTRRSELLRYVRGMLVELCTAHPEELLRSKPGSKILREVFDSFPSEELADSIVGACASSVKEGEEEDDDDSSGNDSLSLFEDATGHLALKHLLLDESESESSNDERDVSFASTLSAKFAGNLMQIASSNRGCFVVAAMLKVDGVKSDVLTELKRHEKEIKKASGGGGKKGRKLAGYEALLKAMLEK